MDIFLIKISKHPSKWAAVPIRNSCTLTCAAISKDALVRKLGTQEVRKEIRKEGRLV